MASYRLQELWCLHLLSRRTSRMSLHPHVIAPVPEETACVFHGFLPPNPSEGCHSVHVKPATQSRGTLPPSPRERCHVDHGKVATQSRRSLPPSEQRDAGFLLLVRDGSSCQLGRPFPHGFPV